MRAVQRFRQAPRAAARVIEGSAFVVSVDRQLLLELNDLGTFLWDRLEAPATLDMLTASVIAQFEVSPEAARADIETVLGQMIERGVISAEDASAP